jgi:hypothetical protein
VSVSGRRRRLGTSSKWKNLDSRPSAKRTFEAAALTSEQFMLDDADAVWHRVISRAL